MWIQVELHLELRGFWTPSVEEASEQPRHQMGSSERGQALGAGGEVQQIFEVKASFFFIFLNVHSGCRF